MSTIPTLVMICLGCGEEVTRVAGQGTHEEREAHTVCAECAERCGLREDRRVPVRRAA